MFKRTSIVLGMLAALAVTATIWTTPASAEGGSGDGYYWLAPGVLEAEGEGIAAAAGKIDLRLCADEGILLLKGEAAVPDGSFDESVEWLGLHVYFGFSGCAETAGDWAAGLVVGEGLSLRAEGVGIAFLKGTGTWGKSGGESGEWSEEGEVLKIGSKLWEKTPVPDGEPKPEPTSCAMSAEGC